MLILRSFISRPWNLGNWLKYMSSFDNGRCVDYCDCGPYSAVCIPQPELHEFLSIVDTELAQVAEGNFVAM